MTLIWLVVALVIGIPVVSFLLTTGIFVALLQAGLALAFFGYIFLGIPYAIYFRARHGRLPRY